MNDKCVWRFVPYVPEKWKSVTAGFDFTREYNYCDTHKNRCYVDEHPTPPAGFCSAEAAKQSAWVKKWKRDARMHYWRTLPRRLLDVLRGAETNNGDDY